MDKRKQTPVRLRPDVEKELRKRFAADIKAHNFAFVVSRELARLLGLGEPYTTRQLQSAARAAHWRAKKRAEKRAKVEAG